jgi:plastocyanin
MKKTLIFALLITAAAFNVQAADIWVDISDYAYSPPHLYLPVGSTVIWTNYDEAGHTVTSSANQFDSGLLAQGQTWSYTFNSVGDFDYYCTPHPWMIAEVHVRTLNDLNLLLTIEPVGGPVVIPSGGAPFEYTATGTNQTTVPYPFNYWVKIYLPNNTPYPAVGPLSFTLPAGRTASANLSQNVPPIAPPGTYRYVAYLGNYPEFVHAWSSFEFSKSASDGLDLGEWELSITDPWCEGCENVSETVTNRPSVEGISIKNSPEPFNPSTMINYAIPENGQVHLDVFNVQGARVATLVDGYRNAGQHQVTFEAGHLPSGMYLYRLNVNGEAVTGKMMLVK